MAKPNVKIYYNPTSTDGPRDANWILASHGVGSAFDRIEWTGPGVNDGDPVGTYDTPLVPDSGTYTFPKAFMGRYSQTSPNNIMDLIPLLGGDYRYPLCINFDGATAGIPYYEAYDDSNANSWVKQGLGGNGATPNPPLSYLKGVTTTSGAPGVGWSGTPIAGNADPNRLALDTAALSAAKDLYCNLKAVVPAGVNAFSCDFYQVVRYAWQ